MKKKWFLPILLAGVIAAAALALSSPAPEAAPECVDPDLCPIVVCPPDHEFVPTTCKECQHCEPTRPKRGKGPK